MDVICEDCSSVVSGKVRRGRCENCYRRHISALKANGAFTPVPRRQYAPRRNEPPTPKHLWDPSVPTLFTKMTPGWGGCWIYTGPTNGQGYGQTHIGRNKTGAHRVAYQLKYGAIPDGYQIDHTCHTEDMTCPGGASCLHRRCINPNHLEAVTARENSLRSRSLMAKNALKTHCIRGHEFTPANTKLRTRSGGRPGVYRQCRICARASQRAFLQRRRDTTNAA